MKPLFGMKPENNNKAYKLLLIGEADECKSIFLTQFAGNYNVFEGHYRN